ncbi:hypothetical protein F4814DRAFT_436193 [Daldinia grandis]|nr:hypothetical protein F4814DRAFT_436193 [Daldinia grandis]
MWLTVNPSTLGLTLDLPAILLTIRAVGGLTSKLRPRRGRGLNKLLTGPRCQAIPFIDRMMTPPYDWQAARQLPIPQAFTICSFQRSSDILICSVQDSTRNRCIPPLDV